MQKFLTLSAMLAAASALSAADSYDVIIRNGMIYDGGGKKPYAGDVAIKGEKIAVVGKVAKGATAKTALDAKGLAVSQGFINMLSWANESLIEDGCSQGEIRQGVTLEVMGEGNSMGPLNEKMRKEMIEDQGDIKFEVPWTTLGEYMEYMVKRGISCNIASFLGATS